MQFILFAWYVITIVQALLGYGTAYRLTKNGGDNGAALWGWLFIMGLAAAIPGLGIHLWRKYRDEDGHGGGSQYTQSRFDKLSNIGKPPNENKW